MFRHLIIGLTLLSLSVGCAQGLASKPSLPSIMSGLEEPPDLPHPRLFFSPTELTRLQELHTTTRRSIWLPIRRFADARMATSPPAAPPADSTETDFRNYGSQLIAYAFTCAITGESAYCDLAERYLLTYVSWDQWDVDGTRGLGHAHMLMGAALAYDWVYDTLSENQCQGVRSAIGRWAERLYQASAAESYDADQGNWWRKSYMQNHYLTIHSALGMAGLALLGEDDRATDWVRLAVAKLTIARDILNQIGDGTWHESIHYQNYALTMSLPFMVNAERLLDVDLVPTEYLRSYSTWRLYNYMPDTNHAILSYGDFERAWNNSFESQNILRFVAARFQDGYAEWMAQRIIDASGRHADVWSAPWYVFEYLYYDPQIQPKAPTGEKVTRVFPDLGAVIWRDGWGEGDLIFGMKAGPFGGRFAYNAFVRDLEPFEQPCLETGCQLNTGHEHDDALGFYIARGGTWLAPETVGSDGDFYRSSYHNTLLIDGAGQYRPPASHFGMYASDFEASGAYLADTAEAPDYSYATADATATYHKALGDGEIHQVRRYVVFIRNDYFLMLDRVLAAGPHRVEWVCHFGEEAYFDDHWIRGEAEDGQILGVKVMAPQPFEALMGHDGQPYVRVANTVPQDEVRFVTLLYPTDTNGWLDRPRATQLDDNGRAIAVRVGETETGEVVDEILITYSGEGRTNEVGSYASDGRVAAVRRGPHGSIKHIFLYDGTHIKDRHTGALLLANMRPKEPIQATFDGTTVAISGNVSAPIHLLAPHATSATLNGVPISFVRQGDHITLQVMVQGDGHELRD